jgi:hypothetical protein
MGKESTKEELEDDENNAKDDTSNGETHGEECEVLGLSRQKKKKAEKDTPVLVFLARN